MPKPCSSMGRGGGFSACTADLAADVAENAGYAASMRIALISDLHGNLLALEATLNAIARHGVDQIVCLGDTATLGADPCGTLAKLRELKCVCITGNHDSFLTDPELIHSYSEVPVIVDAVQWCREQLSAEDLQFVRSFVPTYRLGQQPLSAFLFHGTPRSNMEDLLCTTPADKVDEMLGTNDTTIMACGHTHIQMLRQHRGVLIVNPGSVGMPFRNYVEGREPEILPYAEWACAELSETGIAVSLQRVPLSAKRLWDSVKTSKNPLAPSLVNAYQRWC